MRKNNSRAFALVIGAILSPLAVAAGNAIAQGIIGNRADDLFGWLLDHLNFITWLGIFTGALFH